MADEKNNAMKGIIAIVVIVIAITALVIWQKTRVKAGPRPTPTITINVETGKVVEVVKQPEESFPLTDPYTGQKSCYLAYVDRDGKYLFPGKGMVTMSPTNSQNFGAISVGDEKTEEYLTYRVETKYFQP
jgi:hypothetical protein